jgi:hypothetical protein
LLLSLVLVQALAQLRFLGFIALYMGALQAFLNGGFLNGSF